MNARFMYQLLQEVHESGVAIILIAHGDIDGCTPTFAVEPQVSL
jgi:fructose-1,6-bisphosphatase/sedoheptulose 1,7-bisphosphatase-like protein